MQRDFTYLKRVLHFMKKMKHILYAVPIYILVTINYNNTKKYLHMFTHSSMHSAVHIFWRPIYSKRGTCTSVRNVVHMSLRPIYLTIILRPIYLTQDLHL